MRGRKKREARDTGLDALLDLDGQIFVVDEKGRYWVKFEARRVAVTPQRPQGLRYSLTLHGRDNRRLVGFDNSHSVRRVEGPGGKAPAAFDHRHGLRSLRPYTYRDAATLVADFWAEVDFVLKEKGILP